MASFGGGFASGLMAGQALAMNYKKQQEQQEAGEAFKQGSTQNSTDVVSGDDALANFKKNFVPGMGGVQTADEYIAANPTVFAGLSNRQAGKDYSVGQGDDYQTRDTQFTPNERRAAGLQAAGNYYYGVGDIDHGADAQSKAVGLRLSELGLNKAERDEATQKRIADVAKKWQDPDARFKEMYNGQVGKYNDGLTGDFHKLSNGSYAIWQHDKDGNEVEGSTRIVSREQVQREQQRAMLTDMLAADPTNVQNLMRAQELGIKTDEIELHRKQYEGQDKHWARADTAMEQRNRDAAAHETSQDKNAAAEIARKADQDKREWGYVDPTTGTAVKGWRDKYLGVLQQRADTVGNTTKDKRLAKYDDMQDAFQTALESGDYSTARHLSGRLALAPDQRGLAVVKTKDADGNETTRTVNKFDQLVDMTAQRAGLERGAALQKELTAKYPGIKIDKVGVDVESGEQVVDAGGKHVPLADFVAQQDKKLAGAKSAPEVTSDVGTPLQPVTAVRLGRRSVVAPSGASDPAGAAEIRRGLSNMGSSFSSGWNEGRR